MWKSSVWVLVTGSLNLLAAVGALTACGSSNGRGADAGVPVDSSSRDAPIDAPIDASLGVMSPAPCGFTEASDATNDATAEVTALTVGTTDQSLCGTINTNHFDPDTGTVDIDTYRVSADGTAGLVVRLFGATGAESMRDVTVTIFDSQPALIASGTYHPASSDHAAFLAQLAAGDYTVVITANNATAPAAAVDYKIELSPDPATRCPVITAAADYTEAADGTDSTGNDVVLFSFGTDVPFSTTAAVDAPEPTGLTVGALQPLRITGTSANVDGADDYMDRDTYLVRTGTVTNELSLRLGWADDGNDFDWVVFPADHLDDVGDGLQAVPREEYNVVPVKPDTAYWIWIGSHDGSATLPAMYDLSLCGAAVVQGFAPRKLRAAEAQP